MPIYEYKCESCGRVHEVLAKSSEEDDTPTICGCGNKSSFVKLYSTFAAHGGVASPEFEGCGQSGCCGGGCGAHDHLG